MRSKSGPGGYFYHYGLCELAQRQALLLRKDKSSSRAIKSDRAKVVMTAGCISRIFDITNYIYILREIVNSANQNLWSYYILVEFLDCVLNILYTRKGWKKFHPARRLYDVRRNQRISAGKRRGHFFNLKIV